MSETKAHKLTPSLERAYRVLSENDDPYPEVAKRLGLAVGTVGAYVHAIRGLGYSFPERADRRRGRPPSNRVDPTDRQREMLTAIAGLAREKGYPPTVREIGDATGISSTNGVMCHLRLLRKKGLVEWSDGDARTIRLTGGKPCECCGGTGRTFEEGGES